MNAVIQETPQQAARRLAQAVVRGEFQPEALHVYELADGSPWCWRWRVRKADGQKEMRPMHWNGSAFVAGEPPAPAEGKPLYRLPELLTADDDALVFVVEGEKCADALHALGMVATTSGSSSSASAADWTPLRGRHAVIWPDHDEPGMRYMAEVAAILRRLDGTVEAVDVEALHLPVKGDCVDWLKDHAAATADDVLALARIAPGDDMGAPEPLVVPTEPQPYPLDALPATIRHAVNEVQGFVQAPLPLVASAALAALSVAGQSLLNVKRADRLSGPCSLYLLTVADSGERKTTCDGFFTEPIRAFEAEQAEAAKPALRDYRASLSAWESMQAGVKDALRAASKKGAAVHDLQSKLAKLEADKPEAPRVPKLMHGDETPEHLAWLLAKEWPAGAVVSSEAGVVLGAHGMARDSVMRNLAQLNVLWDGGVLSIGRKTSESFDVYGARLTMALQVQEATLRAFFEQSGALARGTGFLARFLIAWPQSTQGQRPFKEAPANWPALTAFNARLDALLRQPQPLADDGRLEPSLVAFTPDAKAAWVAFHDAIEDELRTGGELYDVRDVASKVADNAARLAALFHLFTGEAGAIGIECFAGAQRVAAWHLSEARRFFGELALPPVMNDAIGLERWLLAYCRDNTAPAVPRRDVQRLGPVRDGDELDSALKLLADHHRVREVTDGRRKLIEPHPALLRGAAP